MPRRNRISVRPISEDDHLTFVASRRSASFLQTPAWGRVKSEWRRESLGWHHGDELVGAALVLYRQLPKVKRYLAYLPEGPLIDWTSDTLDEWLAPMTAHLKKEGAFGVRMGPPVVTRTWTAAQVKAGIADPAVRTLDDLPPESRDGTGARVVAQLDDLGWRRLVTEGGFAAGQPQYVFQIPLAGRTEDDVLKGMNQLWRRNIKKADKQGVEVTASSTAEDLKRSTTSTCTPPSATTSRRGRWPTSRPCARRWAPRAPTGSGSGSRGTRATWSRPRSRSGWAPTRGTPTAPRPPRSATCAGPTRSSGR